MAITRCAHGHLYDTDLYASCPYCNSRQPVINFDDRKNPPYQKDVPVTDSGATMPPQGFETADSGQVGAADYGATQAPLSYNGSSDTVTDDNLTKPPLNPFEKPERRVTDEENKTRGMMETEEGREPVVGWLVCTCGSEKGKDFHLFGKKNTIGRLQGECDVCISGDAKISRNNHVSVGYDPRSNHFHLIPGESTNNVYLNGEVVYVPMLLQAYDTIELGDTTLLFVPFCGEQFDWKRSAESSAETK